MTGEAVCNLTAEVRTETIRDKGQSSIVNPKFSGNKQKGPKGGLQGAENCEGSAGRTSQMQIPFAQDERKKKK